MAEAIRGRMITEFGHNVAEAVRGRMITDFGHNVAEAVRGRMITEFGHNMAETVRGTPLMTKFQVQSQACACEICSDQDALGQVFYSSFSCPP
jgi:hypothetical protein